ncbi:Na+/H+ antiporter subunit D [Microbacterium sp. APC 3898]|uniref:Na+/H+ antiporter subunit D n=1 Tax=Planococcus notacanthi TaxID=3035188 RepID=A0ABT7ZNW8_9BACL|nr:MULTISPECIES: Na+/H+ antiporter subunit D [Terrabacteria group]MDN3428846.1 Na+/H+ antiporter subunit D [Planococcus sp. APC 4016]MDN3500033.1 Na+/H+ antiporter subunit D [Microbacterium sp. APC 3898]
MSNLLLFPIIIPLFFATVLMIFPKRLKLQRFLAATGASATLIAALVLLAKVNAEGVQAVTLGSWPAPFGISMVSDPLSALLVVTTSIITLFVVFYSFPTIGVKREQSFYYPAVLFLMVGVNGAFTTGDIFNLFVFVEVLLMASYTLIVHGGEKPQLRESIKYLLVNIISSALFVAAVAFLYSVTGTLNMADLAVKIPQIEETGILTVIAVMFLVVFGFKAAIFPLYFWLPGSYYSPPVPILALFGALLTKVGVYAIMRTYTLFFNMNITFTHELLGIIAILTILAGCIGALAYFDVKKIIIYNIIIAVGVILFGIAQLNQPGVDGSIFYLLHDMLIKAALFFLVGIVAVLFGTTDLRKMGGLIKTYPFLGWTYLVAAFGLAGIPPLSGFPGKLLIVQGGFEGPQFWGSIVILATSLIVLLSAVRIFIYAFWGEPVETVPLKKSVFNQMFIPTVILVAITVVFGVGAELFMPFISGAGEVLLNPSIYIDAVLKE